MTENVPKPLVKIGYRPILWHVMKYYAHYGHKDFILCLGYKADKIKDYFLNYKEYLSNDFTMSNGGRDIQLQQSDISGLEDHVRRYRAEGQYRPAPEGRRKASRWRKDVPGQLFRRTDQFSVARNDRRRRPESGKTAGFLCAKPSQSFHVVSIERDDSVKSIQSVRQSDILINAGYFVFRNEIFNYIREGEELVVEPFQRLIADKNIVGYRPTSSGAWTRSRSTRN